MIKFEKTETMGWEGAIRGMRNPMNSWDKSDSVFVDWVDGEYYDIHGNSGPAPSTAPAFILGPNDLDLARRLAKGGSVHAKYRRQIFVSVDITAPLYWWKEFDTYKVGTTANSCSTMHKIHAKPFVIDDFSCEQLINDVEEPHLYSSNLVTMYNFKMGMEGIIDMLNNARAWYLETKDKKYWWQMIQLLPSSYNQKRTVTMTYENLYNMYHSRKDHKLDEWRVGFCEWAKSLPYSELFTMRREDTSFQEDLDFFVNDCTDAQLKALYERVKEKLGG